MDFKLNMNWAENILGIQDTFKFVGDHVNNAGGTIKKLYSEVIQDLNPPDDSAKYEFESVAAEDAAISTSSLSSKEISSEEQSPEGSDAVVHVEKQLGHVSPVLPDQLKTPESTDQQENSDSVLSPLKINAFRNENSDSGNDDVNAIEKSTGGLMDQIFPGALDSFKSSSLDVENHDNRGVVSPNVATAISAQILATEYPQNDGTFFNKDDTGSDVDASSDAVLMQSPPESDAIVLVEKQSCHVCPADHIADEPKTTESTDNQDLDSVLSPRKMNVLTNENSDLSNGVNAMKESKDGLLDQTSSGAPDRFEASSHGRSTDSSHENECFVSPNVSPAISTQTLDTECPQNAGTMCDIITNDTKVNIGASGTLCEMAFPVLSVDSNVTRTGLESSSSSISMDSTSLPGCSPNILSQRTNFCYYPFDSDCDENEDLPSSTPASVVLTKDKEVEQLFSSNNHLSPESTGRSDDTGNNIALDFVMETIDLCDEGKLGDSCVFIDDSLLHSVSLRTRKLGSYKKKLQDIFAPNRRLAKEYEQLAIWYGDADIDSTRDAPFNLPKLQTRRSFDSEWELL
ncbi:hypothetical protein UlMin_028341 [Ulmus minor]